MYQRSESMGETRVPVIYIAGSGRSGSTLLERAIGAIPEFTNVGELIDLCRRVAPRNERCGCGRRFLECQFWSTVGDKAFGGWDQAPMEEMHELQTRVARQRHLPRLVGPRRLGTFDRDVDRYAELYRRLYAGIAEAAGTRYVVDASKWPSQALALARGGLDLRVVHLVRDVHGVASSLAKRDVVRPHSDGDLMSHSGPSEAAARWTLTQTEVTLLRRFAVPTVRVRYEDFVQDPLEEVRAALDELRIRTEASDLAHIRGSTLELGASHGLSGNPSRFQEGAITLRADETWRSGMSPLDKALVSTIASPVLLQHRRSGGASSPAHRRHGASTADPQRLPSGQTWPAVSVIVPTRGRPEHVRLAVRSVMEQRYEGTIHCVVVHDQEAPDPSLEDLGRRENRLVTVVGNSATPGLAGARNTGLDLVTDDFIATCDDDDVWHPRKLELQVRRLLQDPDLLVVGSGIRLVLPNGKTDEWPGRCDRVDPKLLLRNRVKELHSSTLVMRRDAFAKAGRYDEELPNGYGEDYDWILRASRVGRIGIVRPPLADIRKTGESYYLGRPEKTVTALEQFLEKHGEIKRSRRGHARILGQVAFNLASSGRRREALTDAGHALALWPLSPHAHLALLQLATGISPERIRRFVRLTGRGMA